MAYLVGAYWGQREESRQASATRISNFLCELAKQDIALSKWYKKMSSRKAPMMEIPSDADSIGALLKTNKRDVGGEVIVELGFSFSAWTGEEQGLIASLSVQCGAYHPRIMNSVVVSFNPTARPELNILQNILRAEVFVFDPDNGVVNTSARPSGYDSLPVWEIPAEFKYKKGRGFLSK